MLKTKEEIKKESRISRLWIIPACLAIIGYFGVFWTLNLKDINFNINMDNNTLEAVKSINYTAFPKQVENQVPLENFTGTYHLDTYGKGQYEFNELPQGNYTLIQVYRKVCNGFGYEGGCRYFKEDIYFPENKEGGLIADGI